MMGDGKNITLNDAVANVLEEGGVTAEHIELCYRLILGRKSDPAGFAAFMQYISSNKNISTHDLARLFFASTEFVSRNTKLSPMAFEERLKEVFVNGINVLVPDNDWVYAENVSGASDTYEPWVGEVIRRYLRNGSVFIDIGANAGVHTMLASKIVGSDGLIYAIDASLENCRTIQNNIRKYQVKNVVIVPIALSDSISIENISVDSTGSNKVVRRDGDPPLEHYNFEKILCGRLDELLPPLTKIDMVKIDVEGREGSVLRGARQLISDHKPWIIAEFHPSASETTYVDDLLSIGYSVGIIGHNGNVDINCRDRASLVNCFNAGVHGVAATHVDILFCP